MRTLDSSGVSRNKVDIFSISAVSVATNWSSVKNAFLSTRIGTASDATAELVISMDNTNINGFLILSIKLIYKDGYHERGQPIPEALISGIGWPLKLINLTNFNFA